MIRLRLLGPIELHAPDGRELVAILSQPKRLALLAYLAASPRGFYRRDTLLALFWPELDETRGRDALNSAVRFLRRSMGSDAIPSRGPDELGIDDTRLWCDVRVFREHAEAGRHGEALELYRGDLLEGFFSDNAAGFEEWLERERARLRASAAKAARSLAETSERDSNLTTAVSVARRAVDLSGGDERVVRELLELLERLGDRAGAIHAYETFVARLAKELDTVPAEETVALIERIRSRPSALAVSASTTPLASSGGSSIASEIAPPPREATRLAGWDIVRDLGRGGMATVYLARDEKHDRNVALKVMRPELALSFGVERFLREIRITAQLAHPHILPLIDSGSRDGQLYLVTPYVPGESLRARLARDGRLTLENAIQIAREVAEALDYAHRSGIVHRDIKPENILLADGHAIVADFGVARALVASGSPVSNGETDPGSVVGSRAYMSPEQVSGDGDISARTDLYSLGCVMYEMFTGALPARNEPVVERLRREGVPSHVATLVEDCISPAPARRPETAADIIRGLQDIGSPRRIASRARRRTAAWLSAAAVVIAAVAGTLWLSQRWATRALERSVIVVLPFRVIAPDSSYNYLREGIVDILNTRLTGDGVPRAVDTRTTLSAYYRARNAAHGDLTVQQGVSLARRLGATYLLMGELVATSGRVTVSGRLVSVPSARLVAEHAETGAGNELDIATRFTGRLMAKSLGEASTRISLLSDSTDAVKAYLSGMQLYRRGETKQAFAALSQALEIDATFAPAALWRAYVAWGAFIFGAPEKRRADSVAWSLRGRMAYRDSMILASLPSIGPNFPKPFTAIELLQAQERAAQANPDRPEAWASWARHLSAWGIQAGIDAHLERAIMADDSAIALDSMFTPALLHRLNVAILTRDSAAARKYSQRLYAIESGTMPAMRIALARLLNDTSNLPTLIARSAATRPPGPGNLELWATYYATATIEDAEREAMLLRVSPQSTPDQRFSASNALFRISSIRGQSRRALAYADSAPPEGLRPTFIYLALADPGYDSLGRATEQFLAARAERAPNDDLTANDLCYSQLWRVHVGDTTATRRAIAHIRQLVRRLEIMPGWRVGRLDVCPLLLESLLDQLARPRAKSTSLDRLEMLLLKGILTESPANVAYFMAARVREAQGLPRQALALIRRRDPMSLHIIEPAEWFLEARLATQVGDTVGAVKAYTRFLEIRDRPDPGPFADDVRLARERLAALGRTNGKVRDRAARR